jgi:hypothetical protein
MCLAKRVNSSLPGGLYYDAHAPSLRSETLRPFVNVRQ